MIDVPDHMFTVGKTVVLIVILVLESYLISSLVILRLLLHRFSLDWLSLILSS